MTTVAIEPFRENPVVPNIRSQGCGVVARPKHDVCLSVAIDLAVRVGGAHRYRGAPRQIQTLLLASSQRHFPGRSVGRVLEVGRAVRGFRPARAVAVFAARPCPLRG